MKISELSSQTGVSMRSLRYYEEKGLIQPKRLNNGYRDYDESILEQVKTIRLYFNLGLSTTEIQEIVDCDPFVFPYEQLICDDVMELYQNKLIEVEQQLNTLTEIKSRLKIRIQKIEELRETMNRSKVNDPSKQ
ncbi:MerR family transcriptional regulator (plasmid) [Mammaliicoccus sciuri]|uniref:MerR family transcriptional regulator n=1 Tax=Mammaliicoccus sciuri TaxID=1296 RepID=UPI002DBA79ED|nr:MerR family transcriptional regulator [Mammaliicoccus sciuri]MEB5648587.1 MerR family transcriptional regulator [Mammaliicoccus sciuri]